MSQSSDAGGTLGFQSTSLLAVGGMVGAGAFNFGEYLPHVFDRGPLVARRAAVVVGRPWILRHTGGERGA